MPTLLVTGVPGVTRTCKPMPGFSLIPVGERREAHSGGCRSTEVDGGCQANTGKGKEFSASRRQGGGQEWLKREVTCL